MTILCTRCRKPIDCGHRCDGDECPSCGTARVVIVETKDARGTLSVQQPCGRCSPRLQHGLTAGDTTATKSET